MNQLLEKKAKKERSDGTPFIDEYIYVSMKQEVIKSILES